MRNYIYIIFFLIAASSYSQRGYKHVNIDGGININGDYSYNLGLELNKGNFSAWEIAVEAHISEFAHDSIPNTTVKEELFQMGAYYKPLIAKHGNFVYNFRYGLLAGRTDKFVISAGAGFEATYHLPSLFAIYIKQSNHYIINIDKRFRHSINLGIKIPL